MAELRPPARIVNHLEESLRVLQGRGYTQLQLLASYPLYMTGLMFHKYEEKPEEHKVYICLPEPNNPHDPQALGILSSRNKRIAFVPRVLTEHLSTVFPGIYSGSDLVVAYCTGGCTPKSAQCLYNVYRVLQALYPPPPSQPLAPPTSPTLSAMCTACRGPASYFILPCRHYACCQNCASALYQRACPTCQALVSGTVRL